MPNTIEVINNSLEIISISANKATLALNTLNTVEAFIQVKITSMTGGDTLTVELSGTPLWSTVENEKVHFAQKDDSDNTLSKRQEVFTSVTPDGGFLIPITYLKCIEKIIIYLEITGAGQDMILYVGGGFDSTQ